MGIALSFLGISKRKVSDEASHIIALPHGLVEVHRVSPLYFETVVYFEMLTSSAILMQRA